MTNTQTPRSKYQGYRRYTVEKNGVIMYRTDVKERADNYRSGNGGEVIDHRPPPPREPITEDMTGMMNAAERRAFVRSSRNKTVRS